MGETWPSGREVMKAAANGSPHYVARINRRPQAIGGPGSCLAWLCRIAQHSTIFILSKVASRARGRPVLVRVQVHGITLAAAISLSRAYRHKHKHAGTRTRTSAQDQWRLSSTQMATQLDSTGPIPPNRQALSGGPQAPHLSQSLSRPKADSAARSGVPPRHANAMPCHC